MDIVISNRSNEAIPVVSTDEGGWCEMAEPGTPLTVSKELTNDLVIGDKPDVSEQIESGLGIAAKALRAFVAWRNDGTKPSQRAATLDQVNVVITNNGDNFVRVILGDGVTSNDVAPGVSYEAHAPGYVEVRELGVYKTDPNQKEAA